MPPETFRSVGSREVVALVITLRELAVAVEHLDAGHNLRWAIRETRRRERGDGKRVFAFDQSSA